MQSTMSGFRIRVPSLDGQVFPPGTTVLLTGRPGVGKSAFARQFMSEGMQLGQHGIYVVTDTPADSIRKTTVLEEGVGTLEMVDLFLEKPRLINDISIRVHETIAKFAGNPVRLVFDSLSTLGMLLNPDVLPPWVLDQRARFAKNNSNLLALMVYDVGIHPPQITHSLQVLADVVLEMKLEEGEEEPKRLFRVFSTRGVPHSAKWYPFTIDDAGIRFQDQPLRQPSGLR
jgi:KaiC/GvpD/RAD55 family RecA-like ATPase